MVKPLDGMTAAGTSNLVQLSVMSNGWSLCLNGDDCAAENGLYKTSCVGSLNPTKLISQPFVGLRKKAIR